jgi:hypothetical protein
MPEELIGLVAVAGLWIMIVAVAWISVWGGVEKRRVSNETLRRAIEAGYKLDPATLNALEKPTRTADDDLRSGITLTALALGLAACFGVFAAGLAPGGTESGFGFAIAGIIVGAIGIGRLVAGAMRQPKRDGDQ